jgi:hypothetical protein
MVMEEGASLTDAIRNSVKKASSASPLGLPWTCLVLLCEPSPHPSGATLTFNIIAEAPGT